MTEEAGQTVPKRGRFFALTVMVLYRSSGYGPCFADSLHHLERHSVDRQSGCWSSPGF